MALGWAFTTVTAIATTLSYWFERRRGFALTLALNGASAGGFTIAPLLARVVTGGLSGACLCAAAGKSLIAGALFGGTGGVIGAFVGYQIRRRLVNNLHIRDFIVAVCEDLLTVGLALFLVSR